MKLRKLSVLPIAGLSLLLVLVAGVTIVAGFAGPAFAQPVQVEHTLPDRLKQREPALGTLVIHNWSAEDVVLDYVSVELVEGLVYAGQAVGSDVATAAQTEGATLRWTGPFHLAAGETFTLRYWVVAANVAPGQYLTQATVSLAGETRETLGKVLVVEPGDSPVLGEAAPAPSPPAVPGAIGDISTTKTATPTTAAPGSAVVYTVVFTNQASSPQPLDTITDVLPEPFQYVGLAAGSQVTVEPVDTEEPTIVWSGSFTVPGNGTLTLRYLVWVPDEALPSPTPYSNTITAAYGGTAADPDQAAVTVVGPNIQLSKTVSPPVVMIGEPVAYTLRLENVGNGQGVVDLISDTLPVGFVFEEMGSGDITTNPVGTTGTIVWHGPFVMPPGAVTTATYRVASSFASGSKTPVNHAVARYGTRLTNPAMAPVQLDLLETFLPTLFKNYTPPYFVASKTASAAEVLLGGTVTYTVEFTNPGSDPGVLDVITDTLPAGFTFLNMVAGSDVTADPSGTTGSISWHLEPPLAVVGSRESLTLKYEVKVSDVAGTYQNSATASTLVGRAPDRPGVATIKVRPPYLLWEDFESGTDGWEPFLHYWRLHPEQWYLEGGAGYGGSTGLKHSYFLGVSDPTRGAHDALYIYRGDNAENEWTDYRVEAWVRLVDGASMGLWVRAKMLPDPDEGKHVEGYYVDWRPNRSLNSVGLSRIGTEGNTAYHFSDPVALTSANYLMTKGPWYLMAVELRGSNIKVFVDGHLLIDYNDSTFSTGSVGFICYKVANGTWDNVLVTPLD